MNDWLAKIRNTPALAQLNPHLAPASAIAQSHPGQTPDAARAYQAPNPTRYAVSFRSFRIKPQDPDNCVAKYAIDSLRYAKLIPDDSSTFIDLHIYPDVKVRKRAEERTEITITEIIQNNC